MAKRKRPEATGEDEEQQPDALIGLTIQFDQPVESEQDAPRGGSTSQVLPVEELPESWNGEYDNAMQYLYHVRSVNAFSSCAAGLCWYRQQADKCPAVVRAENPYTATAPTAAPVEDVAMGTVASTSYQKPSEENRQAFVEQFKVLREVSHSAHLQLPASYGRVYRQSILDGNSPEVLETWYYPIPGNDMAQWRNYIYGKKAKVTAQAVSSESDAIHPSSSSAAHSAEMKSRPKEPSADLLKSIPSVSVSRPLVYPLIVSQNLLLTVLEYLTEWLVERFDPPSTSFVPRRATKAAAPASNKPRTILPDLDSQWIFSLLSGIDSVLTAEDVYTLRELSKMCLKAIRLLPDLHKGKAGAEQELEDQLTGLWMIVAIVADVWGQKDLWDEL